jgi:Uma2 family endonuclease
MYNRSVPVQPLADVPPTAPSVLGPYRDRDYQALPDEPRCELLYGELVVTPAPLPRHQVVAAELWRRLEDHARTHQGLALMSPIDVALFDHSVVQPDIVYVTHERLSIVRRRVDGAPDLLVEVLSPGSVRRDRLWKLKLYAEAGIREYWLVDPAAQAIEFLVLAGHRYRVELPAGETYGSPAIPDLTLDLAAFWREIDDRLAGTGA